MANDHGGREGMPPVFHFLPRRNKDSVDKDRTVTQKNIQEKLRCTSRSVGCSTLRLTSFKKHKVLEAAKLLEKRLDWQIARKTTTNKKLQDRTER